MRVKSYKKNEFENPKFDPIISKSNVNFSKCVQYYLSASIGVGEEDLRSGHSK